MPRKPRQNGLQRIGDLIPAQTLNPLTKAQEKLLNAAEEIRLNPDDVERAYMARQLVQCTLPHRDPGDVEFWRRRNGKVMLVIQRGYDDRTDKAIGHPFGTLPRLLMFWLITEAVVKRTRKIELGDSLSEFMREIGINPRNGTDKRSDARRLREQMRRLFSARITFQQSDDTSHRFRNMDIASDGDLWWDHRRPEQPTLWNSWIELGEKFYKAITAAPVPADRRILRALKQSPLALDLYVLVSYKAFAVSRTGEEQTIPWPILHEMLGGDYTNVRDFRRKARAALRKIAACYRDFKYRDSTTAGLSILPASRPSIPARSR